MKDNGNYAGRVIILVLLGIVAATVLSAVILITLMVTPSKSRPIDVGNGVGIVSLTGGQNAWIDDSVEAHLLACAVSRLKTTDDTGFDERLCKLIFNSDGGEYFVTLLRSDDGRLAFELPTGERVTGRDRYIKRLLSYADLDNVLNRCEPDTLSVNGVTVYAYSYTLNGTSFSGEPIVFTGGEGDASRVELTVSEPVSILNADGGELCIYDENENIVYGGDVSAAEFKPESGKHYDYRISVSNGGKAEYHFSVTYRLAPTVTVSSSEIWQGDSFVMTVSGLLGRAITAETDLGCTVHIASDGDTARALIPVDHRVDAGNYTVIVHCESFDVSVGITVHQSDFEVQNLTVSTETANATVNSDEANTEYVNTIYPLFDSYDDTVYWDGIFVQPAEGSITTQYGVYRYTNGNTTATRHAGIDIANDEGTPIYAPNNGMVLFGGYLQLSGNTIMIEHGSGLHSLFMHMDSIVVATGDYVEKGQLIGYMGTTGYSTGPHLHYQLMIGANAVSPWRAFDGTAGFYQIKSGE